MWSLTPKASWITITACAGGLSGTASYSSMSPSVVFRTWVAVFTRVTVTPAPENRPQKDRLSSGASRSHRSVSGGGDASEILDRDRLDGLALRQDEPEKPGEERQLGFQR